MGRRVGGFDSLGGGDGHGLVAGGLGVGAVETHRRAWYSELVGG